MIKAIETVYKGYRFRSRLEARWAVFFDEMGYDWEYESEGYKLSDGTWYLPDFKINGVGSPFYFEIKPKGINHDDKGLKMPDCTILCGDPVDIMEKNSMIVCPRCGRFLAEAKVTYYWDNSEEGCGLYIGCSRCDMYASQSKMWSLKNHYTHRIKSDVFILSIDYVNFIKLITKAAQKARQARFEHGQ